MSRSIRESSRERDLRNQAIGAGLARRMFIEKWRALGCQDACHPSWKCVQAIDDDPAILAVNREWRKLRDERFKAEDRRRRKAAK